MQLSTDPANGRVRVHYAHPDHLGTPTLLTDGSGFIVVDIEATPFGEGYIEYAVVHYNRRFPGQYKDKETGLHYNYFRYHGPTTGKYLQSDPFGLSGGLNTYSYVLNNPLRYIDPTGLDATATLYPGASGAGHVGIGINTPNTTGFYPAPGASTFDVVTGQPVPGVMQPDTRTPTDTITIPTTRAQDQAIQDFINQRTQNPGNYDLKDRN